MVLSLTYLIIAILSLTGISVREKFLKDEWFNKKNTDQLRGLCAMLIIVHHIASQNFSSGIFHQIDYVSIVSGYLLVGYFFLISGYGLEYGEINGRKHKFNPLFSRIITIIIPYITISLIYCAYYLYLGKPISFNDILISIIQGNPIVKYSWYSVTIVIVYFFFEISKINSSHRCNLFVMLLSFIGYILLCVINRFSEFWYNTVFIVLLGILAARYKNRIFFWIKNHYKSSTMLSLVLLVIGIIWQIKFSNESTLFFRITIKQITLIVAVYLIIIADFLFCLDSFFLKKIAKYSYEIYLTHGLVMIIINEIGIFNIAGLSYVVSVFVGTILLSAIEHLLNKRIIRVLNQFLLKMRDII